MIQAEICCISCFLDSKNIDHIGYQSGCHCLILGFGQCKIIKVVNFWYADRPIGFVEFWGSDGQTFRPVLRSTYCLQRFPLYVEPLLSQFLRSRYTMEDKRLELEVMMVWFRWCSFSIGWLLGSMLIFTGVPVSESQRFFPPRAGDDGLIQPAVVVEERWVPICLYPRTPNNN